MTDAPPIRDDWARFTPRQRMARYAGFAATALVVGWAVSSITTGRA